MLRNNKLITGFLCILFISFTTAFNFENENSLDNLDNVLLINQTSFQVLIYNSSSGLWYNEFLNETPQTVNNSIYWNGHLYGDEGHWGINSNDIYYNAGDVGIGTIIPTELLDVAGDTDATAVIGRARLHSASSDFMLLSHFDNGGATEFAIRQSSAGATAINAKSSTQIDFLIGGSGKWKIDSTGDLTTLTNMLGIGTDTPSVDIDIENNINGIAGTEVTNTNGGTAAQSRSRYVTDTGDLFFINHGSGRTITRYGVTIGGYGELLASGLNGLMLGTGSNTPVIMGTNDVEALRIDGSQNVGIGTASPNAKLEVNGSVIFQGDLNMTNGSITNLWELVSTDGSRIATGTNPAYSIFSGLGSAEIFSNNQIAGSGVTTHALLSTDPGNEKVLAAWQSGKNNSGQYTRNSGGYFPDLGLTNVSILTNIREMWLRFGIVPLAEYFSAENKTSVASLWAFESQKLFLHDDIGNGQLLGSGDFTWVAREGTDIDLYNGDGVHIKQDVIKEFGFSIGDNITSLNANFNEEALLPFVQTTGGGIADWELSVSILCHSEECARALGGSGSPLRSMQTNFSSIDQDNLNLSWWLTTVQSSPDVFTVEVNNNVGSGDVAVFTSSGTFVDEYQSVILPSSMNNKSIVTVMFNFEGNNPSQDVVYVDEILVVGNATTTTLANVTVEDGTLNFGNKECNIIQSAEDGYQDLNITCDNINLIGDVTAISITEIELNVTNNINVQNNVTLGSGATFWSNATCAFISSPSGTGVLEVCD